MRSLFRNLEVNAKNYLNIFFTEMYPAFLQSLKMHEKIILTANVYLGRSGTHEAHTDMYQINRTTKSVQRFANLKLSRRGVKTH